MSVSLKDLFFNKKCLQSLGESISKSYPKFDQKKFIKHIFDEEWEQKELKQRMKHVSEQINHVLNKPYPEAIGILLDVNENLSQNFTNMVFPEFVSLFGLDHFDESMLALKEMTSKSSSEFAVRHFILKYGTDAMKYLNSWSKDDDHHVRRLACEGCRPMLPWSFKLPLFVKDPTPILTILDQLKEDPQLYVQKSVANNLNDISKNHPDLVLKICSDWNQIDNKGTQFIIKRACRTLLKSGNQEALELFGVGDKESVKVTNLKVHEKTIKIGTQFTFSFDIEDEESTQSDEQQQKKINPKKLQVDKLAKKSTAKKTENSDDSDKDDDESYEPKMTKKNVKTKKQKDEEEDDEKDEINESSEDEDENTENGLRIEYKIDYLKQNGTHSSKVFMLKREYFLPNKKITLDCKQKVMQLTTRKHYPGKHYISIIVNGSEKAKTSFNLLKETK